MLSSFFEVNWIWEPAVHITTAINSLFSIYLLAKVNHNYITPGILIPSFILIVYVVSIEFINNDIQFQANHVTLLTSYVILFYAYSNFYIDSVTQKSSLITACYISLFLLFFYLFKWLLSDSPSAQSANPGVSNFGVFSMITSILSLPLYFYTKRKINILFITGILISLFFSLYNKNRIGLFIHGYAFVAVFICLRNNLPLKKYYYVFFITVPLFLASKPNSTAGRIYIWNVIFMNILKVPLTGHGLNSFKSKYSDYQIAALQNTKTDHYNIADPSFAFSEILQIYFELGIPGILIVCYIIASMLKVNPVRINRLFEEKTIAFITIIQLLLFSYPLHHAEISIPFFLLFLFVMPASPQLLIQARRSLTRSVQLFFLATATSILCYMVVFSIDLYRWQDSSINKMLIEEKADMLLLGKRVYTSHYLKSRLHLCQLNNEYKKSIENINLLEKYFVTCDMKTIKGYYYLQCGNSLLAIESFSYACSLIPYKIKPKYYLAKTYKELKEYSKCDSIKNIIKQMPPKINNDEFKKFVTLSKQL